MQSSRTYYATPTEIGAVDKTEIQPYSKLWDVAAVWTQKNGEVVFLAQEQRMLKYWWQDWRWVMDIFRPYFLSLESEKKTANGNVIALE